MKKIILICNIILFSSCASIKHTDYRGEEILTGSGGSIVNINGIDLWEYGSPNQEYKIIGILDYKANDKPIHNMLMNGRLASKCKEYDCDGLILVKEKTSAKGVVINNNLNYGYGNSYGSVINKKILKYEMIKYIE